MSFGVAHRTYASAASNRARQAAGASVFEVDVRTAGERVVVTHFQPLRGADFAVERDGWKLRPSVLARDPSLAEVVDVIPADARILLDPKEHHTRTDLLRDRVNRLGLDPSRLLVSTSAPAELARWRDDLGFGTWRTVGSPPELASVLASGGIPEQAVTVRHRLLTDDVLPRLRAVTPTVVAWTVNDVARARHLVGLGVDGITTDSADVLRAVGGTDGS